VVETIEITSGPLYEDSLVTVTVNATDADEHELTSTIEWLVDGTVVLSHSPTLTGEYFSKNQAVEARVSLSDGFDSTGKISSASQTISNTPPFLSNSSWSGETLYEESSAVCSDVHEAGEDIDDDAITYTYRWEVDGVDLERNTGEINGALFNSQQSVDCFVTPWDEQDAGTEVLFSYGTVMNTPPVLESVQISPNPATTNDTLTAIPGTLVDPDPHDNVSYAYEWLINGFLLAASVGDTLPSSFLEKGDIVQVKATPHDADTGTDASSFLTVQNSPPEIEAILLSPNPLRTEDTLVASPTSIDDDDDFVIYLYDWFVNGTLTLSGSSNLLDSSYFVKGDSIRVGVTPHDLQDLGSQTDEIISVSNTAPLGPEVLVESINGNDSGSDPGEITDELKCSVATESVDPDGDPIQSYSFQWNREGQRYFGSTRTETHSIVTVYAALQPHETWTCSATANDGEEDGSATLEDYTVPVPCAALRFEGGVGYGATLDPALLQDSSTIEVWFNPISLAAGGGSMKVLSNSEWSIAICDGSYAVKAMDSSFGGSCESIFQVDRWHHLVVRVDSSDAVEVFVDGESLTHHSGLGTFSMRSLTSLLVGIPGGTGGTFNGYVGDIRLWDRELSNSEIDTSSRGQWLEVADQLDLVGWWPLIEGETTTAADASNSGNDLGITEESLWSPICPF